MASQDRREREKAELRAKILDAARDLFATRGYDAVSMRKIADAIEYSPTAIYAYFADKESLLRELCSHDFGALAKAFSRVERVDDPIERIRRTGQAYIDFAIKHPNHYRLMFMTQRESVADAKDLAKRGNADEDGYAFLRSHVAAALSDGRFRPELTDVELITQTFWAAVHGVASLQISKSRDPWIDWAPLRQRATLMIDVSIRGMAPKS